MNQKHKPIAELILALPKAELHLHIEGTLEPEMLFDFAQRNGVKIKYTSVEEIKKAYRFSNLQDFLDMYHPMVGVLIKEQDFFEATWAYLKRMAEENVIHTEMFFAPQLHTERGIEFATVINGINRAQIKAQTELAVNSLLMLTFLRDRPESSAMATLEQALPYKDKIIAVGLESTEIGNPPSKFKRVFDRARCEGLLTVVHAGPEGSVSYVWEALDILKVSRNDHGVRSMEDPNLVEWLRCEKIPLTICPISNIKLGVFENLEKHNLKKMLDADLIVTINSDIPSYIGGYITQNFIETQKSLNLSPNEIVRLIKNSFMASFLTPAEKKRNLAKIDAIYLDWCKPAESC